MDEWDYLRSKLREAGVSGVDQLGLFVNNTQYFEPSRFDEVAAAPTLLAELPRLTNARVVTTVGRHLQNKGVGKAGYDTVLAAFRRWAHHPSDTGWVLGDTLARMADKTKATDFMDLAMETSYGASRSFIVYALWRFKSITDVEAPLRRLIRDRDVALFAMSALQRVIGREAMTHELRELLDEEGVDEQIRTHAARQLRKIEKKLRLPST